MGVVCLAQGSTTWELLELGVGFLRRLASRYYVPDPVLSDGAQR